MDEQLKARTVNVRPIDRASDRLRGIVKEGEGTIEVRLHQNDTNAVAQA